MNYIYLFNDFCSCLNTWRSLCMKTRHGTIFQQGNVWRKCVTFVVLLNLDRNTTWKRLPADGCLPTSRFSRDTGTSRWETERRRRVRLWRWWKSTCPWWEVKFKLALSFVSAQFPVGDTEPGEGLQEAPRNNTLLSWCLTKTARISQAKQKTRNFFSAFPGKGSEPPTTPLTV